MNLFIALDVNAAGLPAQRKRAKVASSNLSNGQTTRAPGGGPYRRKDVVFETSLVEASESYHANIGAISILKTQINRTLDLGT